jgi:hypothetical protein
MVLKEISSTNTYLMIALYGRSLSQQTNIYVRQIIRAGIATGCGLDDRGVRRTTQTQNKHKQYRYVCLQWDSNSRSQRSSERKQVVLNRAATVIDHIYIYI